MSEYSELTKKFDRIRDYIRNFYVDGFFSRDEFDQKSIRSYDNERRRIESYLHDYMSFRMDKGGKNIMRSMLNTAKLMYGNSTLYKLKELEFLERICDNVGNISISGISDLLT